MAMLDWSVERVVVKMTDSGAFGQECAFVSFRLDNEIDGKDNFASTVLCGTVIVTDHEGLLQKHKIVVKIKLQMPELRAMLKIDFQFHNEILFYEQILPFLLSFSPADQRRREDRLPFLCRYFYGHNECADLAPQDVIVLENACPRGYRLSEERLHLDFEHLRVALKTLAKYHALSYRAKFYNPVELATLVSNIKETRLLDDNDWMIRGNGLPEMFSVILEKLTEYRGGYEDERLRRFRVELLDDPLKTLRRTMMPSEPLAVLCHGDFNRNNMMFSYDVDGRPVDMLVFDMATVRYASPVIDLSFFLYMNTDRQTRDVHWDELLDTYCAALAAALSDVSDVVRVPNREQLNAEMSEYAFYGMAHVLFFKRVMVTETFTTNPIEELVNTDNDNMLRMWMSFGGDKATDLIIEAFQHFIDVTYTKTPLS